MSIAIATNLKLPLAVVRASPGPTTNQLKAKPYRRANSRISATSWHGFGVPEEPEPTWVQTHRGVPNLSTDKPDKPCKVCLGKGKVACGSCDGIGRTNGLQYRMLPSGMWPEWCTSCRGSGLWWCQRCMGTGIKRDPIGFRFPHDDEDEDS